VAAGDPSRSDVAPEDMTWTIRCDETYVVTAARLARNPAAFGYLLRESDRCVLASLLHMPAHASHLPMTS
jgi:hypothetical protein